MSNSVCKQQTHCITFHAYTTRQPDYRARFLTSLDDVHANLGLNPEEPGMFPSPPFQTTVMMIKKGEFLVNACHRLALARCVTHFIQWTPTAGVHPLRVFLVCCNIYLFRAHFSRDVYPSRNICKHREINVKGTPIKYKTGKKKAELQIEHFMTSQQSCLVSKDLTHFIRRLLLLLLPLVATELKAIHLAQFLSGSVPEGVARSPGNSIC